MPRVSSALVEVWKDRALAAEARYDALLAHVIELKAKGAYVPTPGRVVPPPMDPDAVAMARREQAVVDELAQVMVKQKGLPEHQARAEAERIRGVGLQTFTDA